MVLSNRIVFDSKILTFIKEQEASGILSSIGLRKSSSFRGINTLIRAIK